MIKIQKYLPFLVGLIIIGTILVARFILGGPEDSWICQNGQWVKHGSPSGPSPAGACQDAQKPTDNNQDNSGEITMTYQPMQCDPTPWAIWFQAQHAGEELPKNEKLIQMYYREAQSIILKDVKNIPKKGAVCQACSVCPTSHYFQIAALSQDVDFLTSEGWH